MIPKGFTLSTVPLTDLSGSYHPSYLIGTGMVYVKGVSKVEKFGALTSFSERCALSGPTGHGKSNSGDAQKTPPSDGPS